nr:hypothetical protein [Sphingosinithalassobacter tenebrarum]
MTASDGSASHRHIRKLGERNEDPRDLADAVHYLCLLHGRHPGVVDHALNHAEEAPEREWLQEAADAFATERGYLVRLVAAAGPLPSTPGQAESEAAAAGQRHALDMLAQSDRAGCAAGAAIALVLDWQAIREVLDAAALRLGMESPLCRLPIAEETAALVASITTELPRERAMMFGAQQVYAQHRGLWDLLEARASAREMH